MAKELTWYDLIENFMAAAYGWPRTKRINQTYIIAVIMKLFKDPPTAEIIKLLPPGVIDPILKRKERRHKYRRTQPRYLRSWGLVKPKPTEWRIPPGLTLDIIMLIPPELLNIEIQPPLFVGPGPGPTTAPPTNFVQPPVPGTPTDLEIKETAGHGYVYGTDADFDTCRNKAVGDGKSFTADSQTYSMSIHKSDPNYQICRSFFKFNIPDTLLVKTITSVIMEIWGVYNSDTEVTAQESTWEGSGEFDTYNDFTGVLFGSTAWDHGTELAPVKNTIEFNAQGRSFIGNNADKTISICCREKLYDYDDNDPGPTTQNFDNGCYFGDSPVSPYRAKLQVVYLA